VFGSPYLANLAFASSQPTLYRVQGGMGVCGSIRRKEGNLRRLDLASRVCSRSVPPWLSPGSSRWLRPHVCQQLRFVLCSQLRLVSGKLLVIENGPAPVPVPVPDQYLCQCHLISVCANASACARSHARRDRRGPRVQKGFWAFSQRPCPDSGHSVP